MERITTLIIGAGPAGLATAGRLREANLPFEIVEKSNKVGNAWHNHYDRLHLHTVKQWSHLPHLKFPTDYPTYVPRKKLTEYFDQYAEKFNIKPHFNTEVLSIKKTETGEWQVETNNKSYICKNTIITTGVNRIPFIPTFPGQENFKGKILHSIDYKNPQPFLNQSVLVIGMGNTGAEVAFDLSLHDIKTYISVRGKVSVVPRDLNGRPVQVTSRLLEKLPFGLGDWLGTTIRNLYFGDLSKYGLHAHKMPPAQLLKQTGKTPVIDIGTIQHIKEGRIKILPKVNHFTETGVEFSNGKHIAFDTILLATGYRAQLEDFLGDTSDLVDKAGYPKSPIGKNKYEGLYFVGFDNYKLGGILGTIYKDSLTVSEHIDHSSKL